MYSHINNKDRILIVFLLRKNYSYRKIANEIGVNVSTISREIERNWNIEKNNYSVIFAKTKSRERRLNSKKEFRVIENDKILKRKVLKYLRKYYSPEQISGILKKEENILISHKAIYAFIKRSYPKGRFYLRHPKRRRNYGTKRFKKALKESTLKRINTRGSIIEQRKRLGDFEGDTVILGGRRQRLYTLVDRKSGYLIVRKLVPDNLNGLSDLVLSETLKVKNKIKTITFDNGSEFAQHKNIEQKSNIKVYFAYPYHSWERGTNENTNGLIRQFFPKKKQGATISVSDISRVQSLINHRPRKRLNWLTPYQVFVEKLEP